MLPPPVISWPFSRKLTVPRLPGLGDTVAVNVTNSPPVLAFGLAVKAVVVVHHETSTGVLNPIAEIARVAKAAGAFTLVDGISSVGGVATDTDARVLGPRGPIPGLYAAGEITGHFYGSAPNAVAVLRALVYGRIAGREAAAQLHSHPPGKRQAR